MSKKRLSDEHLAIFRARGWFFCFVVIPIFFFFGIAIIFLSEGMSAFFGILLLAAIPFQYYRLKKSRQLKQIDIDDEYLYISDGFPDVGLKVPLSCIIKTGTLILPEFLRGVMLQRKVHALTYFDEDKNCSLTVYFPGYDKCIKPNSHGVDSSGYEALDEIQKRIAALQIKTPSIDKK